MLRKREEADGRETNPHVILLMVTDMDGRRKPNLEESDIEHG